MTLPGQLPIPPARDPDAARAWVAEHLGDLALEPPGEIRASERFRGGQGAADQALAELDIRGYAARRNQVLPRSARGASAVSPYVRYNLLTLGALWDRVAQAPARDRDKYRDELLWQEYARHLYARLGRATARPLRHDPTQAAHPWDTPWPAEMACMAATRAELERDGWLVNQTRMWMSSQWTVRGGWPWQQGEARFFTHLLDGSRAANRLGWQWTVGTGTGRPYGFSRWQVRKRAPELCRDCGLADACPIEGWPDTPEGRRLEAVDPRLGQDPDLERTAGPEVAAMTGHPDYVWLTAESLGDADPALAAHPDRPAVFVFDEPLLSALRLSGKRLIFLAEVLGDLSHRRELVVCRGRISQVLADQALAVTFAPVPGFRRHSRTVQVNALHPYPWLTRPGAGSLSSFSAWRKHVGLGGRDR